MVAFRILDVIYTIGLRIGTEMTKKHMSSVFQKFFSCFDQVLNERGDYKESKDILSSSLSTNNPVKEQALIEMRETFSPEMAFLTYIPFCKLVGRSYMEKTLKNDELIHQLCLQYDKNRNLYSKNDYPAESSPTSRSSNASHRHEHSLELPKFIKSKEDELFLRHAEATSEEDLPQVTGNDATLKKAYDEVNKFNWSDFELLVYDQEEKRVRDEKAILDQKIEDALKDDLKEIARNLLKAGVDRKIIYSSTGVKDF